MPGYNSRYTQVRGDLLHRLVPAQRLQGYPSLELARKLPSRRHLVFLRYPVEYTLTPCPISRDQLTQKFVLRERTAVFATEADNLNSQLEGRDA